jgi:protein-L-isoaspartate(D-aspartate) O-methyltransferase
MRQQNEYTSKRQQMVETLIARGIGDKKVINAFRKVERHLFMDEALWPQAYEDHPTPIGERQTISQPYIVALMTEILALTGTEKVLEIGTGSGYQTAILAELADRVYSIERIPVLAKRARKILDQLKYTNIIIRIGDGTQGWRDESPFDAIIVTAAAPDAPDPLLQQLGVGGRLIIPIGGEDIQDLMLYVKEGEDRYREENYGGCRFVKLIGEHGWKA